MEKATFGAGCFWGVEIELGRIPGVLATAVGYEGGKTVRPTYKDVCRDQTGHAEVVELTFDPAEVTYEHLVETFFSLHDPTQLNRQGPTGEASIAARSSSTRWSRKPRRSGSLNSSLPSRGSASRS